MTSEVQAVLDGVISRVTIFVGKVGKLRVGKANGKVLIQRASQMILRKSNNKMACDSRVTEVSEVGMQCAAEEIK